MSSPFVGRTKITCFPVAFSFASRTKPNEPSLRYLTVAYFEWSDSGLSKPALTLILAQSLGAAALYALAMPEGTHATFQRVCCPAFLSAYVSSQVLGGNPWKVWERLSAVRKTQQRIRG